MNWAVKTIANDYTESSVYAPMACVYDLIVKEMLVSPFHNVGLSIIEYNIVNMRRVMSILEFLVCKYM